MLALYTVYFGILVHSVVVQFLYDQQMCFHGVCVAQTNPAPSYFAHIRQYFERLMVQENLFSLFFLWAFGT